MSAAYWACALTEVHRERTAVRFLTMAGYETYCPWLGTKRSIVPLFPGYCFVLIADRGWWAARWSIAVRSIVGTHIGEPARVPDSVIGGLRARERKGLIVLPEKPGLRRGDQVRITRGPMAERLAISEGMKGRERVEVLLALLGSVQRVELARRDTSAYPAASACVVPLLGFGGDLLQRLRHAVLHCWRPPFGIVSRPLPRGALTFEF
jgi:transcription antitermination factor NusG